MSGSLLIGVPRMAADFGFPSFFRDEFLNSFFDGELPEGTKTYKKDILDKDGKKVGEKVIHTYSSGRSNCPASIAGNFPPCNIYTDKRKRRVYAFACAGYDPENVSFEVNEENPSYINLVLKSGMTEVKEEDCNEAAEDKEASAVEEKNVEEDSVVYDYHKVVIKDCVDPFFVDRDRYDIEKSEVWFKNGMVYIAFEPKKVAFKPKIVM